MTRLRPSWATPGPARVGLELNISCPNVHTGCVSIGSDPGETETVVGAVRTVWPGLLVAKLTPNVTDITAIGRAAEAAGADAIAAVNTYKGLGHRPHDPQALSGQHRQAVCRVRPSSRLALRAVYELFESVSVPIIGMGGVATVQDVLDFMACGARVVAVGSAAFREPVVWRRAGQGVGGGPGARGLTLDDLVGWRIAPLTRA